MLLSCGRQSIQFIKPFKFMKFWVEQVDFKDMVRRNRTSQEKSDIFICLKQKMRKTKISLANWSRERFGDMFKQFIIREEVVKLKDELFEQNPTPTNRSILQKAQAERKKYLHFEKEF